MLSASAGTGSVSVSSSISVSSISSDPSRILSSSSSRRASVWIFSCPDVSD